MRALGGSVVALLGVSLLAAAGGGRPRDGAADNPIATSIVALLATPNQYQGKSVRMIGVLQVAYERNALYLHREDYDHHIATNAVWVSFDPNLGGRQYESLSGRYVVVQGVFDATLKGSLGMYAGAIRNVAKIELWEPPPAGPLK